ncbi:MAG TPA: hypothetical protein IAA17_10430 [Candidatus Lachnoclostridium stercorigallinarum]|uniref:Uncharacterized protein n=1 Tax=Candidatus Lachnoclostridium stercorigallinarum TaxID=2838634 RepID=A0A9D2GJ95_9FIRM|nr:hypothetical protein [Candidatus Lachnoclostridium stercorigallinarum]
MGRRGRKLIIEAVEGSGRSCRKLGLYFFRMRQRPGRKELALRCLRRAAQLGDEMGYLLYHRLTHRGRKVIDDRSYRQMAAEYGGLLPGAEKRRLRQYLLLGTDRQKAFWKAEEKRASVRHRRTIRR